MRRNVILIFSVVSTLFLATWAVPALAQSSSGNIMGGNNSADYQPPTRNPQDNIANLNQTGGNLQPQSQVSQTSLPNVTDLRVPGVNGAPNTNTTKTTAPEALAKSANLWPIGIIGVLTAAAMIYVIAQPDPNKRQQQVDETPSEPVKPTPVPKATATKKKKTPAKTAAKRRGKSSKKRR